MTKKPDATAVDADELLEKNLAFAEEIFAYVYARPAKTDEYHLAYDPQDHTKFVAARARMLQRKRASEKDGATAVDHRALSAASKEVDELRGESSAILSFHFRSLTPKEYDELIDEHPADQRPTTASQRRGNRRDDVES